MKVDSADAEFAAWPVVPEDQRPKRLFHSGLISENTAAALKKKGWAPQDVRLLPNATDDDRRLALKAWLEGLRYGTVELDPKLAKWLELEAKVLEVHKGVGEKPIDKPGDSASAYDVLNFGNSRSWTTTSEQKALTTRRKRGVRPRDTGADK